MKHFEAQSVVYFDNFSFKWCLLLYLKMFRFLLIWKNFSLCLVHVYRGSTYQFFFSLLIVFGSLNTIDVLFHSTSGSTGAQNMISQFLFVSLLWMLYWNSTILRGRRRFFNFLMDAKFIPFLFLCPAFCRD